MRLHKHIFVFLLGILSLKANSQQIMNIHLNDGTVIYVPMSTIDSITYTIGGGYYTSGSGVTDFEGNNYPTIIFMNGQEWMSENLNTELFNNGDPIPNITDNITWSNLTTPAWCYADNNIANGAIYGKLYNYYVVDDSRNICPTGWHVPSQAEWVDLYNYLGGDASVADKMKTTGTEQAGTGLWQQPNNGTNESGFSGKPGGFRFGVVNSGSFNSPSANAIWWSSTVYDASNTHSFIIDFWTGITLPFWSSNELGLSIRCLKD